MATTFSGPVASQGGFVTPTYTSGTLPYFIPGNIVYLSDLNTLAFGGVEQWYDQKSGAGLGTGGNVGPTPPAPTKYTSPTDYQQAYFNGMGTSGPFVIYGPTNSELVSKITSMTAGDTFTATDTGSMTTVTVTVNGPFVDNMGEYVVTVTLSQSIMGGNFQELNI